MVVSDFFVSPCCDFFGLGERGENRESDGGMTTAMTVLVVCCSER